jgi:two-component system response regulator AtoC
MDVGEMDFDIPASGSIFLKEITKQAVRKIERNVILKMLEANHWNRKKAAKALNISYRAMLYKLKETGLQSDNDARFTDEAPAI